MVHGLGIRLSMMKAIQSGDKWVQLVGSGIKDGEEPQLLDVGEHFTGPSGMVNEEGRAIVFSITQDKRTEDEQTMNVDREHSSLSNNVEKGIQRGKVEFEDDLLRLRIFIDRSMIEAYINGVNSLTTRVYPSREDSLYLELFTEGESEVKKMNVWRMGSAY